MRHITLFVRRVNQHAIPAYPKLEIIPMFKTPFHINNGLILDRDYNPVKLYGTTFRLTNDRKKAWAFLDHCKKEKFNLIRLELTESLLTYANGDLKEGEALDLLDAFMERAFQEGFYLIVTPITEKIKHPDGRSEHAIRDDEPIYAERFFDALFRHVNPHSGKMFFEYENLAGLEYILALETFTPERLNTYLHHMGCFVLHFFPNTLLELYCLDRGPIPEELRSRMDYYTQIQLADLFPDPAKIRIPKTLAGIPPVSFSAFVREKDSPTFLPCPTGKAASKSVSSHSPHGNGGEEGFLTLEADCAMEFLLHFPWEVKSALFRPSLQEKVEVQCSGRQVKFTLEKSKYGTLEVNYDSDTLPRYTVYIFMDPIIPAPAGEDVIYMDPGRHGKIPSSPGKTLFFKEGVHYFQEERLELFSNSSYYLAPGAVLKCGIRCEEGENIHIYGSGILDGTLTRRKPGENWKGRADDSFVHFFRGKNILWDGPVIYNSPFWNIVPEGTRNMTIRHHKALTWAVNSDGVQPRSCIDLLIEDCFFKCSDDSIAIKTRRESGMHSYHITIRNIITWNDLGSSLEIGHTSQADLLEDVVFENIQIIRGIGKCHIFLIDHSKVRNVLYKNIYIEGEFLLAPEICFTIAESPIYSTDDTRAVIEGIRLENLHLEDHFSGVYLKGFDETHQIKDVTVKGIYIHKEGKVIPYEGEIPYHKLEFASKVKYEKGDE